LNTYRDSIRQSTRIVNRKEWIASIWRLEGGKPRRREAAKMGKREDEKARKREDEKTGRRENEETRK
jgi:hypothetical protein